MGNTGGAVLCLKKCVHLSFLFDNTSWVSSME